MKHYVICENKCLVETDLFSGKILKAYGTDGDISIKGLGELSPDSVITVQFVNGFNGDGIKKIKVGDNAYPIQKSDRGGSSNLILRLHFTGSQFNILSIERGALFLKQRTENVFTYTGGMTTSSDTLKPVVIGTAKIYETWDGYCTVEIQIESYKCDTTYKLYQNAIFIENVDSITVRNECIYGCKMMNKSTPESAYFVPILCSKLPISRGIDILVSGVSTGDCISLTVN